MKRIDKSVFKTIEMINAQYGKEMPKAPELEEKVIGALMNHNEYINTVTAIIKPESFYENANKLIYETILDMNDKKQPFDLASLTRRLFDLKKIDEVGGPVKLTGMTNVVTLEPQLIHHCRVIEENRIKRELIYLSAAMMTNAYDGASDVYDTLVDSQDKLNKLMLIPFDAMKKPPEMINELFRRIKHNLETDGSITGFPTGIRPFDQFTSGLQKTDLTIIAGEPSMGKTSFAVTILNNLTRLGEKASLISLEMSSLQIIARVTAQETGLSSKAILSNKLHNNAINLIESQAKQIEQRQLFIDPDCNSDLKSILASIRYLTEKLGIKVFFIDYIQLITIEGTKDNREGQLATISRSLKNLAKELDISIIVLCQLNRDPSKKELPTLGRLRGSGQLEEAADNVIFVHRAEYHKQDYFPDGVTSSKDKAMIIIAKGRNIGTTDMYLYFEKTTGLFSESKPEYDFGDYNPDQFHEPDTPF